MSWSWRFERSDGSVAGSDVGSAGGSSQGFPTQSDAETWIGESWRDLVADGIDRVLLLDEGRVVYGPMSLHPED